jgi:hypothetical protein
MALRIFLIQRMQSNEYGQVFRPVRSPGICP